MRISDWSSDVCSSDLSLYDLTVAEAAYLAALPKAPSNYNPVRHHDRAKARRDWVIERMLEDGVLTQDQAKEALATPLPVPTRPDADVARADWFAEEVRRELAQTRSEESRVGTGGARRWRSRRSA